MMSSLIDHVCAFLFHSNGQRSVTCASVCWLCRASTTPEATVDKMGGDAMRSMGFLCGAVFIFLTGMQAGRKTADSQVSGVISSVSFSAMDREKKQAKSFDGALDRQMRSQNEKIGLLQKEKAQLRTALDTIGPCKTPSTPAAGQEASAVLFDKSMLGGNNFVDTMNKFCSVVADNPSQSKFSLAVATYAWCVAHRAQFKRGYDYSWDNAGAVQVSATCP